MERQVSAGRSHSGSHRIYIIDLNHAIRSIDVREAPVREAIVFRKLRTNEPPSNLLQRPSLQIFPARLPRQFHAKESAKRAEHVISRQRQGNYKAGT